MVKVTMVAEDAVNRACQLAQQAGADIVAQLGPMLGRRDLAKAVTVFRHTLLPGRQRGRKPKEQITAAHRDWKNGVRGVALYRSHIPGWDKHSHYRRQSEARGLMDAIYSRERRERKRTRDRVQVAASRPA